MMCDVCSLSLFWIFYSYVKQTESQADGILSICYFEENG